MPLRHRVYASVGVGGGPIGRFRVLQYLTKLLESGHEVSDVDLRRDGRFFGVVGLLGDSVHLVTDNSVGESVVVRELEQFVLLALEVSDTGDLSTRLGIDLLPVGAEKS